MATDRTPSDEARAIGARLRDARKAKGLRAWDVAVRLGCSQQNYEFIEMGRNRLTIEKLHEIAEAMGYTPRELVLWMYSDATLGGDGKKSESEPSRIPGRAERQVAMAGTSPHAHRSVTAPLSRC